MSSKAEVTDKENGSHSPRKDYGTVAIMHPPLDYSFFNMIKLEEVQDNTARNISTENPNGQAPIYHGKCFKLNNNCLTDIHDLQTVAKSLFADADSIAWVDLSFNELQKVDEVLLMFPQLQILYLHGNQISDYKELEKLAKLKNLKKLSLHGNPIENVKGYKYTVLAMLPQIQFLDFARVTKADRRTASTLEKMTKGANKKPEKHGTND